MPRLACFACGTALPLAPVPVRCPGCGALVVERSGIVRCASDARLGCASPVLAQYRQVRRADGHVMRSAEEYQALPSVSPSAANIDEWRIRQQSLDTLLQAFSTARRSARVLDLGAGNGWLSQRLTVLGHAAVAVDLNDDGEDGLGAAAASRVAFPRVQAGFERLPFEAGQFDVVVFNASLHYADEPGAVLAEGRRMLAGRGALVVMDSPVFALERDGERMVDEQLAVLRSRFGVTSPRSWGRGYLTLEDLGRAAVVFGMEATFIRSSGPWLWRLRRGWSALRLGRQPAMFGVWVAR
ncbi:MAG: methyltransferase domain-containing protein [Vicinamibacterales bacterium]